MKSLAIRKWLDNPTIWKHVIVIWLYRLSFEMPTLIQFSYLHRTHRMNIMSGMVLAKTVPNSHIGRWARRSINYFHWLLRFCLGSIWADSKWIRFGSIKDKHDRGMQIKLRSFMATGRDLQNKTVHASFYSQSPVFFFIKPSIKRLAFTSAQRIIRTAFRKWNNEKLLFSRELWIYWPPITIPPII